jgi:hypothetical protein
MTSAHIFISHASQDDDFVKQLRTALESHQLPVWVDSRNLRGGAKLAPEIEQAIETARQTIVVLSPNTINSPWVRREIQKAIEVERQRKADGYRMIPLLLPGVEPSALALWFDDEPVGVKIQLQAGGLSEAMPQILAALGERAPDDPEPEAATEARPLEELILKLSEPRIELRDDKGRAKAKAQLIYQPADHAARKIESAMKRSKRHGPKRVKPPASCSRCRGSCCTTGAAFSFTEPIPCACGVVCRIATRKNRARLDCPSASCSSARARKKKASVTSTTASARARSSKPSKSWANWRRSPRSIRRPFQLWWKSFNGPRKPISNTT